MGKYLFFWAFLWEEKQVINAHIASQEWLLEVVEKFIVLLRDIFYNAVINSVVSLQVAY